MIGYSPLFEAATDSCIKYNGTKHAVPHAARTRTERSLLVHVIPMD